MANANLVMFIVSAVGGFLGALIGSSMTSAPALSPSSPKLSPTTAIAAAVEKTPAALEAPPEKSPACPEPDCPACPGCPETECPVCPACGSGASEPPKTDSNHEGGIFRHNLRLPGGTWNARNYYPLTRAYNRFERWYDNHHTGKGVWKWTQYFPAYERHLGKFIDKSWAGEEVHMAELGIFSGGSLEMWQAVFGPGLRLWGLDIALMTKQYQKDDTSGRTKIFNLDQTNAQSWNEWKKQVPKLDILIDDGLHLFTGQKASFDNILEHIAPGGVFMTEDISDGTRPGKKASRNDGPAYKEKYLDYSFEKTRALHYDSSHVQETIDSVHYYPYLLVVEKRNEYLKPLGTANPLRAIKHGTLWKPIDHGVVKGKHAD